jgi:hypothetical protein
MKATTMSRVDRRMGKRRLTGTAMKPNKGRRLSFDSESPSLRVEDGPRVEPVAGANETRSVALPRASTEVGSLSSEPPVPEPGVPDPPVPEPSIPPPEPLLIMTLARPGHRWTVT